MRCRGIAALYGLALLSGGAVMAKKKASALSVRAVVIVVLALVVIAFFALGRSGSFHIKSIFGDVSAEQKEPAAKVVPTGVQTGKIEAAKNVTVNSSAEGGVKTGDLKSETGTVTVTHTPGQPTEAPPPPKP